MSRIAVDRACTLRELLLHAVPGLKASTLKARLKHGAVLVNGAPERRADRALVPGDEVELLKRGDRPSGSRSSRGLDILYVDEHLVVVEKPSGLLTVAKSDAGRREGEVTVLSVLRERLAAGEKGRGRNRGRGPRVELHPCHRLDRETSGVLVVPRSRAVQEAFFAAWQDVEKVYEAVVHGVMTDDEGLVDAPLLEDERSLSVRVSSAEGARPARTRYRVLARGAESTLVELALETGRKHQIRVHLAHLGHHVLGDDRYGGGKREAPRLLLHARRLRFIHPVTSEGMVFERPAPSLFRRALSLPPEARTRTAGP